MKDLGLLGRKLFSKDRQQRVGAVGLEFAQQGVNAVQMQADAEGTISVRAYESVTYPNGFNPNQYIPAEFKKLLKPLFKQANFSGREVNVVLPSGELKTISVNYQLKKGQSEAEAIAQVASERIEGDVHDYVVDYLPVRRAEDSATGTAIVALAKQQQVTSYLECLRKSGLQVSGLEISPAAIKRLVSVMQLLTHRENVLVINFGTLFSYLSIISGRRLLFDEEMNFGESVLLQKLQDALDLDRNSIIKQVQQHGLSAEDNTSNPEISATLVQIVKPSLIKMAAYIKRALMYAAAETRGDSIAKIYLTGSIARWRGIDKVLGELLDLPVEVIPNPLGAFGIKEQELANGAKPELAVSTGLALRGLIENG